MTVQQKPGSMDNPVSVRYHYEYKLKNNKYMELKSFRTSSIVHILKN
jgi:hypothetical protein